MLWNADPIEVVLGIVLALTGVAGMFSAYARSSVGLTARANRTADLLGFFGTAVLGIVTSTHGAARRIRLGFLFAAAASMVAAVIIRRGAAAAT